VAVNSRQQPTATEFSKNIIEARKCFAENENLLTQEIETFSAVWLGSITKHTHTLETKWNEACVCV